MAQISLKKVNKIYKNGLHAVRDMSFDIDDGEFTVLVGPSGCGKSTLLRMIAGLEEISFGELYIDGVLVNELPPRERGISMVFQNYALFPHMTVFDNIAFGLKVNKADREEIKKAVESAAEILGLSELLTRKPAQLSGGQKQRVALGRALVNKPRIFLLDEPLSNLDAKLRASMRSEIIKLHNKLGTTFVYVTHDQTEAMTMGTKIVVLKDGVLQQEGSPRQIYSYPENLFTATFLGSPQMNMFNSAELVRDKDKNLAVAVCGSVLSLPQDVQSRLVSEDYIGKQVKLGVRPEHLHIKDGGAFTGAIQLFEPLGSNGIAGVDVNGTYVNVYVSGDATYREGEKVGLDADAGQIHLFDCGTGESLLAAPRYNYLKAKAEHADGKLNIKFAGGEVSLDWYDRLTDDNVLGADALFAIGRRLADGDGDIELSAKIDYVSRQSNKSVVYATLSTTGERIIFECGLNCNYKAGDSATLSFDSRECMLFDCEKRRVISAYPSRGRMRKLYVKGQSDKSQTYNILADERFNEGYLLYCGADDDYFVVSVPEDYPVYGKTKVKVVENT